MTQINNSLLENVAPAQKEWADFVHRRIKEYVVVSRQLVDSRSLAEVHQVWPGYFRTAVDQFQKTEKIVKRGQSAAHRLVESAGDAVKCQPHAAKPG